MQTIEQRSKESEKDYKKVQIWILVLNAISLVVMILAVFVPYNKINAGKFVKTTFTNLYQDVINEKKLSESEAEAMAYSLIFTCSLIADVDNPIESNKDDKDSNKQPYNIKDIFDGNFEVLTKDSNFKKLFNTVLIALKSLEIKDEEVFNQRLDKIVEEVSGIERNISVFELITKITPETAFVKLITGGASIFYHDAFGALLVSCYFVLVLLATSVALNCIYLITSIICIAKPEAAIKRYCISCLGKDQQGDNTLPAIKRQGLYFFLPYLIAYFFMLLIGLLPSVKSVFVKNFISCTPFTALTVSPFAYVFIGIDAVISILSLAVWRMKYGVRYRL